MGIGLEEERTYNWYSERLSYEYDARADKPLIIDVKEYEYFGVIILRQNQVKRKKPFPVWRRYAMKLILLPFAFRFLDQEFDKMYRSEQVITKLTTIFAVLGIAISCLGSTGPGNVCC